MSELNASLYHRQNTHSVAFKFFSESVKEIEKQIHSTADLNFFTTEQIDFIVLICDQFQKLVKLRGRSKLIDNLLTYNFPEFFKPIESNVLSVSQVLSKTIEPKRTANQFLFVCDVCDEEVPILNNDLEYSTETHASSPYHQEVVSVMRKLRESEMSTNSSLKFLSPQPEVSPVDVSNKFVTRVPKTPSIPDTISQDEQSFQRFSWIQSNRQDPYLVWRHSEYYCCLCDVSLPTQHNFDAHVKSYVHKTNVATDRQLVETVVNPKNQINSKNDTITSMNDGISSKNDGISSKNGGITLKNEIGSGDKNVKSRMVTPAPSSQIIEVDNGVRVCTLCNVRMPSEANFVSHTSSVSHRTKAEIFEKTFSALTKAFNEATNAATSSSAAKLNAAKDKSNAPKDTSNAAKDSSNAAKNETSTFQDFMVERDGTPYCSLCNVQVPQKAQQESHFRGSFHKEQLKISKSKKAAPIPFTDFIITKDSKRYCILCNINLPGESQLSGHKYGKLHKQKMKEYEQKYYS